ncbi:MAG TPA: hypothetical protein VHX88_02235 [Solirubrobacteraceae bacterium]|jgi:hypothetical protein|nr:hypothetical protein [Solirubrobacteraceae bacterium]
MVDTAPPSLEAAASSEAALSPRHSSPQLLGVLRALAIFAVCAGAAGGFYGLDHGSLTDDTYTFLDWGRDLRHGFLPLLEKRTFHPLPVALSTVFSAFGQATPTFVVVLNLTLFALMGVAAFRITRALKFGFVAAFFSFVFVMLNPSLAVDASVAYVNVPFAACVVWALAYELEGRREFVWPLLFIGGLLRPEGWAFSVGYGLYRWWQKGHPFAPARWWRTAALALGPMIIWLGSEWVMFGSPATSFNDTRAPNVQSTGTDTATGLASTLHIAMTTAPLVAAGVGVLVVLFLGPKRSGRVAVAATVIAAFTLIVLASSKFNVPGRHFSVLFTFLGILAGIGVTGPARLLAVRWKERSSGAVRPPGAGWTSTLTQRTIAITLAAIAGGALVFGLAFNSTRIRLLVNFRRIHTAELEGASLDRTMRAALPMIDTAGAQRHVVVMLGAIYPAQLDWDLGVPFNVVIQQTEPFERLLVEPSKPVWEALAKRGLTQLPLTPPPPHWRLIVNEAWKVWGPPGTGKVRLGSDY